MDGGAGMSGTLARRCAAAWDRAYHRYHRLVPMGPLLQVGRERWDGAPRRFDDGTLLEAGAEVGTLHLDNRRLAALAGSGRQRIAARFGRLLRESLQALAEYSTTADGEAVAAWRGTTWMQPHGLTVGFTTEPLPPGWRRRLLTLHFALLRACFAPAAYGRGPASPEPRQFWITRRALLEHFLRRPQ